MKALLSTILFLAARMETSVCRSTSGWTVREYLSR